MRRIVPTRISDQVTGGSFGSWREWHAALPRILGVNQQPEPEPGQGVIPRGPAPRGAGGFPPASIVLRPEDFERGIDGIDDLCEFLYVRGIQFEFTDFDMEFVRLTAANFEKLCRILQGVDRIVEGETDGETTSDGMSE